MTKEHDYIIQILRHAQTRLTTQLSSSDSDLLSKFIEKLSSANNLREELERAYTIKGFDQLALKLLYLLQWIAQNPEMMKDEKQLQKISDDVRKLFEECFPVKGKQSNAGIKV